MGAYSKEDAIKQVVRVLRDYGETATKQELVDTEIDAFLAQATARYSIDRPLEVVEDVAADGTRTTALPTGFVDGTSLLLRVEMLDADDFDIVDPRAWSLYRTPDALTVRWLEGVEPAHGETVRIAYTAARALATSAADTTVLDADFWAVCDLAVSNCCAALAQKYARTAEPLLNAGVVAYRTKAQEWDGRATAYRKAYEAHVGKGAGPAAAGSSVNWDSRNSYGSDWLTHPRWTR